MIFKQSRLFAMSITKLIFPDTIELTGDRVRVTKKRLLGITGDEEEILYTRIASTRTKRSIFTATVIIETSGGSKQDLYVKAIWKKQAKELKNQIEQKIS